MYWIGKTDDELRRNVLSIRFTDAEHKAICDHAWKNRISASALIRDLLRNEMNTFGAESASAASRSNKGGADGKELNTFR